MYLRTLNYLLMYRLCLLLILILPLQSFSQRLPEKDPKNEKVFISVEKMPEFPGGKEAMNDFIVKELNYPVGAKESGIEGKVYLSFIVNSKGKVGEVEVLRGVHPELDKEAIRIVKAMPDWMPGSQDDVPVDVRLTLPFYFKLN
ncbi:MAG: energy transducer TonB [Bacteroidetes bacterium]|nr:energy transducer TonB [Bacteroidota bacterium]